MKQLLIFFSIVLLSCNNNKEKANNLNDESLKYGFMTENIDSLNKSLILIEKAIRLDESNTTFRNNKISLLMRLKKYDDAYLELIKTEKYMKDKYELLIWEGIS